MHIRDRTWLRTRCRVAAGLFCLILLLSWQGHAAGSSVGAGSSGQTAILALLETGQFAALDELLSALQQGFEEGVRSEGAVASVFSYFKSADPSLKAHLNQWIAERPQSYAARLARSLHFERLGWTSRGTASAQDTPDVNFARMRDYFELAETDLKRAITLNPSLSVAHAALIEMARAHGSVDAGSELVRNALAAAPKSRLVHFAVLAGLEPRWGGSLKAMEKFIKDTRRRVGSTPGFERLNGYLDAVKGETLANAGHYEAAVGHFDRSIARYGSANRYLKRGRAKSQLGRHLGAAIDLQRARELAPHSPRPWHAIALNESARERYPAALRAIEQALQRDHQNLEYLSLRALILASLNRTGEAEDSLLQVLNRNPGSITALDPLARFYLYDKNDPQKAAAAYSRLAEITPYKPDVWRLYIEALYAAEDCNIHHAAVFYGKLCEARNDCDAGQLMRVASYSHNLSEIGICPF